MTTKHSPIADLKKQADTMAAMLKKAERGERVDVRFAEKIAAARRTHADDVALSVLGQNSLPFNDPATTDPSTIGKKAAGRLLDGVEHSGMPVRDLARAAG